MSHALPTLQGETAPQAMTLSDLLYSVKHTLDSAFRGGYWIIAEVVTPGYHRPSGHWYMELAQVENGGVVAKVRANMWAGTANRVVPKFRQATGSDIQKGIELMMFVTVTMHPVYGFALVVQDINPDFTLGHLERIKKETIDRLTREGVINLNKHLPLPLLLQRVAVISSATAAGWGDFDKQIEQSAVGRLLQIELFTATMQGDGTAHSVIQALDRIHSRIEQFDVVVLIRGGGSRMDLSAFDGYELSCYLANFPLPIVTGIGHERDESVADLVAHTPLKTPTAVADFLIRRIEYVVLRLFNAENAVSKHLSALSERLQGEVKETTTRLSLSLQEMTHHSARSLSKKSDQLYSLLETFRTTIRHKIIEVQGTLQRRLAQVVQPLEIERLLSRYEQRLQNRLLAEPQTMRQKIEQAILPLEFRLKSIDKEQRHKLAFYEEKAKLHDPSNIMRRGFLPVTIEGKTLTQIEQATAGDEVRITLIDGTLAATIRSIEQNR